MKNTITLIVALLPVAAFAQVADEAFVFSVLPRMETVIKEVRECQELPMPGKSAAAKAEAMTPQWLVAENGIGKMVAPEDGATGKVIAGESCRLTERKVQLQDGWQVFMRFNGRNFNTKVTSAPPQVGTNVNVEFNARGELSIVKSAAPAPVAVPTKS